MASRKTWQASRIKMVFCLYIMFAIFFTVCVSFLVFFNSDYLPERGGTWIWVGGEMGRSWKRGNSDQNILHENFFQWKWKTETFSYLRDVTSSQFVMHIKSAMVVWGWAAEIAHNVEMRWQKPPSVEEEVTEKSISSSFDSYLLFPFQLPLAASLLWSWLTLLIQPSSCKMKRLLALWGTTWEGILNFNNIQNLLFIGAWRSLWKKFKERIKRRSKKEKQKEWWKGRVVSSFSCNSIRKHNDQSPTSAWSCSEDSCFFWWWGGGTFGLISSVNSGTSPLKVKIRENLGSAS